MPGIPESQKQLLRNQRRAATNALKPTGRKKPLTAQQKRLYRRVISRVDRVLGTVDNPKVDAAPSPEMGRLKATVKFVKDLTRKAKKGPGIQAGLEKVSDIAAGRKPSVTEQALKRPNG
jgi:hypothetical protein